MRKRTLSTIGKITGLALIFGGTTIISNCCLIRSNKYHINAYKEAYKAAGECAVKEFGDRAAPLTSAERKEWYRQMGVEPENGLTIEQLHNYSDRCKSKLPNQRSLMKANQ